MDAIFWWVGAVVSGCAAMAVAAAAVILTVLAIIQIARAFWIARLFRPALKPYADNPFFRWAARVSFAVRCFSKGVPTQMRAVDGSLMWDDSWLNSPQPDMEV